MDSQTTASRLLAVSDIHGCFKEFCEVLDRMAPDFSRDYLIVLGDLIDRGPDSYDVVRKVKQLQSAYGNEHVILLKGNHEQMAIEYFNDSSDWWNYNGNEFTLDSYSRHGASVRDDLDYFAGLPLIWQRDGFLFVHAGLDPLTPLEKQRESDLLWIREPFLDSKKQWPFTIVFGHTPTLALARKTIPVLMPGKIAIDTGCVYGGFLTGVELKDGEVIRIFPVKRKEGQDGSTC